MADDINILDAAGSTVAVATDDCGAAGHAQFTKLAVSTDGSATPIPADANGLLVKGAAESMYSALSAAAVLTAQIKGSAGKVFDFEITKVAAGRCFATFHDQTGAPASTDTATIVKRIIIPGSTAGDSGGAVQRAGSFWNFATGIGIRVRALVADNDTNALSSADVAVNVGYV